MQVTIFFYKNTHFYQKKQRYFNLIQSNSIF